MFDSPMAIATFLAFVFVTSFLLLITYLEVPQKLIGFLDARATGIAKELEDARRLRDEAQALLDDYKTRAKNAENEAKAIVEQAKLDAERVKEETQKALSGMIARRAKAAETKIAQAEAQAIADVRAAAASVAVSAAQEVLSTRISDGLGAKLIDQSIAGVKTQLN